MAFPWKTPAQIGEEKNDADVARLMAFRLQIKLHLNKLQGDRESSDRKLVLECGKF